MLRKISVLFHVLFCCVFTPSTQAATVNQLWGTSNQYKELLTNVHLLDASSAQNNPVLQVLINNRPSKNGLVHLVPAAQHNKDHIRLQQKYNDITIFGYQLTVHKNASSPPLITGQLVTSLDTDLKQQSFNLNEEQVKDLIRQHSNQNKIIETSPVIYIDKKQNHKALLSYKVISKSSNNQHPGLKATLIDANDGRQIKSWNIGHHFQNGGGPGGVQFSNLDYKPGHFQYGNEHPNLNSLGNFLIHVIGDRCHVSNNLFKIISFENHSLDELPFLFPLSYDEINYFEIQPFSYACSNGNYLNLNDDGYAPVNGGYSPINDVTYFLNKTYEMYAKEFNLTSPLGNAPPIYIYTHVSNYENATTFSIPDMGHYPLQILFGNGNESWAPLTSPGVSSHEFAHLITTFNSDLIYDEESGAINESFSDMAHFAFLHYLVKSYPWVWKQTDWQIGVERNKAQQALRYMNHPSLDGKSIEHSSEYTDELDVHEASGVYNRAFYLLSHKPGWSPIEAYKTMLFANQHYWSPYTEFNFGACGAIQSGLDLNQPTQDIVDAFNAVGVACPFDVV